jgi:hypothetical protein
VSNILRALPSLLRLAPGPNPRPPDTFEKVPPPAGLPAAASLQQSAPQSAPPSDEEVARRLRAFQAQLETWFARSRIRGVPLLRLPDAPPIAADQGGATPWAATPASARGAAIGAALVPGWGSPTSP